MTRPTILALLLFVSIGALEACRKKVESAPTPATTPSTADAGAAQRSVDSLAAANAARRRADSLAAANAAANAAASTAEAQRAQTELAAVLRQKVYFGYDKDLLREDATAALEAKAAVLNANAGVALAITGHTDERGTSEYNLALGQRRAAQVKRYLVARGVAEGRLTTTSLGDSQPAVQGTDESAYQQNRRAEFDVRGTAGTLVRPRS